MNLEPKISEIFQGLSCLLPEDDGYESYLEDIVAKGRPDAVFRPATKDELKEIIARCQKHEIPFTPCGSQTSVTGASIANKGILISMEKLNQIIGIEPQSDGTARVRVQPGIILSKLQDEMIRLGFFYPPDPTSREEVQLGATVATNATGEDSYYYGPTRNYVLSIEILTAEASFLRIEREKNPQELNRDKNKAGYLLDEEIDPIIGSEGTLGIISEIELLVLPRPNPFAGLLLFFQVESEALRAVQRLDESRDLLNLRCLEYLDHQATRWIGERSERYRVPDDCCTLYLKFELENEEKMEVILEILEKIYAEVCSFHELFASSLLAQDYSELAELRRLRHHVPATINEIAQMNKKNGGGKIGSDWWVPLCNLSAQFEFMRSTLSSLAHIPIIVFGHIGNGHPHVNLLPADADQKEMALVATKKCMENAALLGGGVAGEHGLGKIKTWALAMQWDQVKIAEMLKVKKLWDPKGLCAPGNLFEEKNL